MPALGPLLEPGGYRLMVRSSAAFAGDAGTMFRLEPDGAFSGHARPSWFECQGALSGADHARLTDALNEAHVLVRSSPQHGCNDCAIPMFEIAGIAGAAAGHENAFFYDSFGGPSVPELDAIVALTLDPMDALGASGACTACPLDESSPTCYPNPLGASSTCVAGAQRACGDATVGEVLACDDSRPELFQCDGALGWAPAMRWTAENPALWRWFEPEFGRYRVEVVVPLVIQNLDQNELSHLTEHLRFEDADGNAVAGPPTETIGSGPGADADHVVISLGYSTTTPSTPFQTASVLALRLRERPWDASPFAGPIAITIHDESPY